MKTKRHNYSKLFEIFRIRWLLKRRLLDEDKMIIWKIRIAIDKMKIIIRLFDYSIDFRIIEYLMPKYAFEGCNRNQGERCDGGVYHPKLKVVRFNHFFGGWCHIGSNLPQLGQYYLWCSQNTSRQQNMVLQLEFFLKLHWIKHRLVNILYGFCM